jgi:phospholipid/cholesterol/gamma-HCH transport system substrate-binding protein
MNQRRMRFAVGTFLLATLGLLVVLVVLFSRGLLLFQSGYARYTIVCADASGVGPGTPVRRSGVRIGEVRDTQLDDASGQVRITALVDRHHAPREGDRAILVHSFLGGDTTIDLVPTAAAVEPPPPLPNDSEIPGQLGPDVLSVLNQTSNLVPSTQEALNEIRKSLQRYEKMAPLLEETTREYRELARATRDAIPELRRSNDEILVTARNWGRLGERLDVLLQTNEEKLVRAVDRFNDTVTRIGNVFSDENQRNVTGMLRESRQTLDRISSSITRTDEVLGNLQQATKPMAERGNSVMKNLDESAAKLNYLLVDTRELVQALVRGDGSLRRLLADPALYNNLTDASCMLVRILPRLDRVLHDAEVFTDKIARHPESLGLGGVVRPSAGLK